MTSDEILLIRDIRRAFAKAQFDSDRMEVSVQRGAVHLTGKLSTMRQHPNVVIKDEVAEIEKKLRKDPRIKALTVGCRIAQGEMKSHSHEEHAEHKEGESAEQKPAIDPNDVWAKYKQSTSTLT